MANISNELQLLKDESIDGARSRSVLISIFNNINENGTSATTLNGMTSDYFVSKLDLNYVMGLYLNKIEKVNDFETERGNCTLSYASGVVNTPFDKSVLKSEKVDVKYDSEAKDHKAVINDTIFTENQLPISLMSSNGSGRVSLATSNAIFKILGYGTLDELEQYINEHQG